MKPPIDLDPRVYNSSILGWKAGLRVWSLEAGSSSSTDIEGVLQVKKIIFAAGSSGIGLTIKSEDRLDDRIRLYGENGCTALDLDDWELPPGGTKLTIQSQGAGQITVFYYGITQ
jgi:hypothetical protein